MRARGLLVEQRIDCVALLSIAPWRTWTIPKGLRTRVAPTCSTPPPAICCTKQMRQRRRDFPYFPQAPIAQVAIQAIAFLICRPVTKPRFDLGTLED